MVKDITLSSVEKFGLKTFGVFGTKTVKDSNSFDLNISHFWQGIHSKLNVLGMIVSFQIWHFLDELVVFHFQEVYTLACGFFSLEPFVSFLFLNFFLLACLVEFDIYLPLKEFAFLQKLAQFFSKCDQIFDGFLILDKCVKLMRQIFVAQFFKFDDLFQQIKQQQFPEFGGRFFQNLAKFLIKSFDIIDMLSDLLLFLSFLFSVQLEVDNIFLEVLLDRIFVQFQERMIFPKRLFNQLILSFSWFEIYLLRMQQIIQILFLNGIKHIHRFLAIGFDLREVVISFGLCFVDTEWVIVIVALDRILKMLCHPALSILVSPKLADLLQIHAHVEYLQQKNTINYSYYICPHTRTICSNFPAFSSSSHKLIWCNLCRHSLHLFHHNIFITNITNNSASMNTRDDKNQLYLLSVYKNKQFSKKLSNIEEDQEMESQIRMPFIPKKQKDQHKSEVKLGNKLNKILNINEKRNKNSSSVQGHKSSYLSQYKYSNPSFRSQNLPQLKPLHEPKRNKSSLDKILADRNDFVKAYFQEIARTERLRKNHPEEEGVQFQFPEIRVGNWKVRGYLKQNHILLKGTHKDSRICIKKYNYQKIYDKIRKDYQTWVESKFSFEN